jgi:lipopolysaccharide transport system permease protein
VYMNIRKSNSQAVYINLDTYKKYERYTRFFSLLSILVVREIKGRYRRSTLGPIWGIIQPFLYLLIFTFIRGVLDIPSEGIPYPIFAYSALVPWMLFSNGATNSIISITKNSSIIKKIALPKEIFPIVAVSVAFIDFLISFVLLIVMMVYFHIPFQVNIIWVPVLVVLIIALSIGISFGFTAFGTYRDDFRFVLPFLLQIWMLASPIIYPVTKVPAKWQLIYKLNPMVGLIEGFRNAMIKNAPPDFHQLAVPLIAIVGIWAVMWPLFRYMSRYFSDVL